MPSATSQADFEQMFDSAPISLWLEDYSALKQRFDGWREQGVVDFQAHVEKHPELLGQCSTCLKVIRVNQKSLQVLAASSQEELIRRLPEVFRDDMFGSLKVELGYLWSGNLDYSNHTVNYALDGRRMDVRINVRVIKGYEATWERVLVS